MLKIKLLLLFIIFNLFFTPKIVKYETENFDYKYKNDIVALIEIPKINFKKNIYSKNSPFNDVDRNLMLIGDMPSYETKFIVAGHSGIGSNAYFNDLVNLNINDEVIVYYNNSKYIYNISKIYDIPKTGKLYLDSSDNGIIILITCHIGTENQTIYKGILKQII